jgi:hypothetical protein
MVAKAAIRARIEGARRIVSRRLSTEYGFAQSWVQLRQFGQLRSETWLNAVPRQNKDVRLFPWRNDCHGSVTATEGSHISAFLAFVWLQLDALFHVTKWAPILVNRFEIEL